MIFKTPALSTRTVPVFAALFKAQLPDTLQAIRQAIPEWSAVHVVLEGPPRPSPSPEEMRDILLAELEPEAMLYEPIYALTTPEFPPNVVATFVPDRLRPKYALDYPGFRYVYYPRARARLKEFFDRALGGIPEGHVGAADALVKGKIAGQAVLEGWTWSLPLAAYQRTMEGLVDPRAEVHFWDSSFGYETTGEEFLRRSPEILGMLDVRNDRLYFDAGGSWFLVLYPGGQLRVGLLG